MGEPAPLARVLVVDDDLGTRITLADILDASGFPAAAAASGREGLEKAGAAPFDIALVDLSLPDMEGTALMQALRSSHPGMDCVVITGHASFQNAVRALELGASGYFTKPLVMEDVLHRLRGIAERRRLGRELAASEERFRLIFNSGNDAVFVHGLGADGSPGRFVEVNDVACRMLGVPREELLRRGPSDIVDAGRPLRTGAIMDALERDGCATFETVLRADDGRHIPAEMSSRRFELDGLPAVLSVARDLTERKRAEEELRSEEEFEGALLDSMRDGLFMVGEGGAITFVNPALCAMTGFDEESLVGSVPPFPFVPAGAEGECRALAESMAGGGIAPPVFECALRRRDGSAVDCEVSATPLSGDRRRGSGWMAVVRDVTARKRLESLRQERARAELYSILASALPVFAGGVPPSVRDALVHEFADRFERNMKPRFNEAASREAVPDTRPACAVPCASPPATVPESYVAWLGGLFEALGARSSASFWTYGSRFELLTCPWREEAHGNPVFCLMCRAMVTRSLTWAAPGGSVRQWSSIAGGAQTCTFFLAAGMEAQYPAPMAAGAGESRPAHGDKGEEGYGSREG